MKKFALVILLSCIAFPAQAEDLIVRGDRLFLPIEVGGAETTALLDSGAELTVLNRAFAEDIGIGAGEEVSARGTGAASTTAELVEGVTVIVLGREIDLPMAAVMDLSDIERRLVKSPVPVILGREVFDAGALLIDIEGGSIAWASDDTAFAGVALPLTTAHGVETIPVTFGEDTEVSADFDLGNGTGLLVSSELIQQLGLEPVGVEPGGGIGGSLDRLVVFVPEMTLAAVTFRSIRAHVSDDLQVAANVGVSILRRFLIVTDFPNRQIWVKERH